MAKPFLVDEAREQMREIPEAATQPTQAASLDRPRTGFEAMMGAALGTTGGYKLDKRGIRANRGPFKGKSPGEIANAGRKSYAGMGDGQRQVFENMATGADIRSQREVGAQKAHDEARTRTDMDPATAAAAMGRSTSSVGGGSPAVPPATGSDAPAASAPPVTLQPKPTVGYDGTANTPVISADQFRQSRLGPKNVAEARAGIGGKSARMPSKLGGETPGMTVVDTANGGRVVAGQYGTGSSRPSAAPTPPATSPVTPPAGISTPPMMRAPALRTGPDGSTKSRVPAPTPGPVLSAPPLANRGKIDGMPTAMALKEPGAGRDITRKIAQIDANKPPVLRPIAAR
jgi:hypothetical protein